MVDISTGAGKTNRENLRAKVIDMNFGAGKVVMQMCFQPITLIDAGIGEAFY